MEALSCAGHSLEGEGSSSDSPSLSPHSPLLLPSSTTCTLEGQRGQRAKAQLRPNPNNSQITHTKAGLGGIPVPSPPGDSAPGPLAGLFTLSLPPAPHRAVQGEAPRSQAAQRAPFHGESSRGWRPPRGSSHPPGERLRGDRAGTPGEGCGHCGAPSGQPSAGRAAFFYYYCYDDDYDYFLVSPRKTVQPQADFFSRAVPLGGGALLSRPARGW